MKRFRDPRLVIALVLLLVAVFFLGGSMRLIRSARAAEQASELAKGALLQADSNSAVVKQVTGRSGTNLDPQAQPTPTASETPGDTNGIIALAIVIVVTIVLGAAIGVRRTTPGRPISK